MPLLYENIGTIKIIEQIFFFSLIGSASNKFHLKLKELLLILKTKPSLNIAKESMPLLLFDHVA